MATTFIKESLTNKFDFNAIRAKATEIANDREDFYVRDVPHNLWMCDDGTLSFNTATTAGIETKNLPTTNWALSQLSIKLGMPANYAEKCISAGHADLAAQNVNTWLCDQKPGKRSKSIDYVVRQYGDNIDAIVTKNYTMFDSPAILNTIDSSLRIDDWQTVGSYISDERLHVRLIQDKMLDVDGEDLFPGICIDSSDVGRTAFNVTFFIWKRVCTNGMCISKVGGQLYHQRHMGITANEVYSELSANLKMIPTLISRSEAIIKSAQKKTVDLKDEHVFQKMVADIRKQAMMSEDEAKAVLKLAEEQYDLTLWGIGNAMTLKAQDYELDRRIVIENAAGKIIA